MVSMTPEEKVLLEIDRALRSRNSAQLHILRRELLRLYNSASHQQHQLHRELEHMLGGNIQEKSVKRRLTHHTTTSEHLPNRNRNRNHRLKSLKRRINHQNALVREIVRRMRYVK